MLNDLFKILLPIIITGIGILVWDIFHRIDSIELDRSESKKYIIVLQQSIKIQDDQEKRIRFLEKNCYK